MIVQITDSCPECEPDHIDIQALTYNKLSPMSTGRISIQYRRVECVPPQKIVISVDNSVGPGGWLRLFVEARPACTPPAACGGCGAWAAGDRLRAQRRCARPAGGWRARACASRHASLGSCARRAAVHGQAASTGEDVRRRRREWPGGQQAPKRHLAPARARGPRADARRGARRARAAWRR